MEIKRLPDDVKAQLRSGVNVVDVPQCINELVLNSLDAKSTLIAVRVNLQSYRLQVVDNGVGISKKNLDEIGEFYMTTKCTSLENYKKPSKFYGFKGEFLASLKSKCTKLVINTRIESNDTTYSKIFINNDSPVINTTHKRPSVGGTITIEGFLHNLPVRQKRVNQDFDLEAISRSLESLSVIHPKVSFTLRNDINKKIIFENPQHENVEQAFINFCPEVNKENLGQIKISKGGITVNGLICKKAITSPKYQLIYINKRPIVSNEIQKLINQQFLKTKLVDDRVINKNFAYVCNIRCPYSYVQIFYESGKDRVELKQPDSVYKCVVKLFTQFFSMEKLYKPVNLLGEENKKRRGPRSKVHLSDIEGVFKSAGVKRKAEMANIEVISSVKKQGAGLELYDFNKLNIKSPPKKKIKVCKNTNNTIEDFINEVTISKNIEDTKIDNMSRLSFNDDDICIDSDSEENKSPGDDFNNEAVGKNIILSKFLESFEDMSDKSDISLKEIEDRTAISVAVTIKNRKIVKKHGRTQKTGSNKFEQSEFTINMFSKCVENNNNVQMATNNDLFSNNFKITVPNYSNQFEEDNLFNKNLLKIAKEKQQEIFFNANESSRVGTFNSHKYNNETKIFHREKTKKFTLNIRDNFLHSENPNYYRDRGDFSTHLRFTNEYTNYNDILNEKPNFANDQIAFFEPKRGTNSSNQKFYDRKNFMIEPKQDKFFPAAKKHKSEDFYETRINFVDKENKFFLGSNETTENQPFLQSRQASHKNIFENHLKRFKSDENFFDKKFFLENQLGTFKPLKRYKSSEDFNDHRINFVDNVHKNPLPLIENRLKIHKSDDFFDVKFFLENFDAKQTNFPPKENRLKTFEPLKRYKSSEGLFIDHRLDFIEPNQASHKNRSPFIENRLKIHKSDDHKHNFFDVKKKQFFLENLDAKQANLPLRKTFVPLKRYKSSEGFIDHRLNNFIDDNHLYIQPNHKNPLALIENHSKRHKSDDHKQHFFKNQFFLEAHLPPRENRLKTFEPLKRYKSSENFSDDKHHFFLSPINSFPIIENRLKRHKSDDHKRPIFDENKDQFLNSRENRLNTSPQHFFQNKLAFDMKRHKSDHKQQFFDGNKEQFFLDKLPHKEYEAKNVLSMKNYFKEKNENFEAKNNFHVPKDGQKFFLDADNMTIKLENVGYSFINKNLGLKPNKRENKSRNLPKINNKQKNPPHKIDKPNNNFNLQNKQKRPLVKTKMHSKEKNNKLPSCPLKMEKTKQIRKNPSFKIKKKFLQKHKIKKKNERKCRRPKPFNNPPSTDDYNNNSSSLCKEEIIAEEQKINFSKKSGKDHNNIEADEHKKLTFETKDVKTKKKVVNILSDIILRNASNNNKQVKKEDSTSEECCANKLEVSVLVHHECDESYNKNGDLLKNIKTENLSNSKNHIEESKLVIETNIGDIKGSINSSFIKNKNEDLVIQIEANNDSPSKNKKNESSKNLLDDIKLIDVSVKEDENILINLSKISLKSASMKPRLENQEIQSSDESHKSHYFKKITKNPEITKQKINSALQDEEKITFSPPNRTEESHYFKKITKDPEIINLPLQDEEKITFSPPIRTEESPYFKKLETEVRNADFINQETEEQHNNNPSPKFHTSANNCTQDIFNFEPHLENKDENWSPNMSDIMLNISLEFAKEAQRLNQNIEATDPKLQKNFNEKLDELAPNNDWGFDNNIHISNNMFGLRDTPEKKNDISCDLFTNDFFSTKMNNIKSDKVSDELNIFSPTKTVKNKESLSISDVISSNLLISITETSKQELLKKSARYFISEDEDSNSIETKEWVKNTENDGASFYINNRTGMTMLNTPDFDKEFLLKERIETIPKGFSPILKPTPVLDTSMSSSGKNKLYEAMIESYKNELDVVKWKSIMKNQSPENFFKLLYEDQIKNISYCDVLDVSKHKFSPRIINFNNLSGGVVFTKDLFNNLNIIGQLDKKFIVAMAKNNTLLILFDQHAVHERIRVENLYNEYCVRLPDGTFKFNSTKLDQNIILKLKITEENIIISNRKSLESLGISYLTDNNLIKVTEIPSCVWKKGDKKLAELIKCIFEEIIDDIKISKGGINTPPKIIQNIINSEACRGAVMFGDTLQISACIDLITQLSQCNTPFQCAHGRPTLAPIIELLPDLKRETSPKLRNLLK